MKINEKMLIGFRDRGKVIIGFHNYAIKLSFGDFVVLDPLCSGLSKPIEFVGRLIQVRVGRGAFGSPMYLIRKVDGELISVENAALWKLNCKDSDVVRAEYSDDLLAWDTSATEYSIYGEYPLCGFLIDDGEDIKPYHRVDVAMIMKIQG